VNNYYQQQPGSSGMGVGGAAAMGAGAGFLGGVLLANAMTPNYYPPVEQNTYIGECSQPRSTCIKLPLESCSIVL
jgi:hypothetical protein